MSTTITKPEKSAFVDRFLAFCLKLWVVLVVAFILAFVMNMPSERVLKQWQKPKEIDYDRSQCTLAVVEGSIDWNNIFELPRRHYLFIGRGKSAPGYGVYLDYTFQGGYEDKNTYIRQSKVEWTPEGVTFIEESGNRLFIPKENFIGGR